MKISVITVAWNAAATISDTLRSVAAQTGVEIEHIIVDGGSTDDTVNIVGAHAGAGVIFISEPDNGLYDAMNKGVARASGELIGFLNADDYFCRTDAMALVAEAAAKDRYAQAIAGSVAIVRADNIQKLTRAYPSSQFSPWMLRFGHMPPHPGFYARREAFKAVGRFDPTIRIGADFEWMVRFFVLHAFRAVAIPETLVTLREGGLSNSGFASRKIINREAVSSLRRHGIATAPAVVWLKYLFKIFQYAGSAYRWPAPEMVQWPRM